MKKLTLVLLVAVLVASVSLLSACRDATNSSAPSVSSVSEPSSTDETASSETASGETVPITYDLDGNTINADLFAGKKLTMVNLWATFCSPCIVEMPYLGELSSDYADKDFQIVGIVSDVVASDGSLSQEQVALAMEIVSQTKAAYPHLLPTAEIYALVPELQSSTGVPATLFIDRNGKPVGDVLLGSQSKKEWAKIIDEKLASLPE